MGKFRLSNGTATFDEAENRASIKFIVGQTESGNDKYATQSVYNLKKQDLDNDLYANLSEVLRALGAFRNNPLKGIYNNITKNVVIE